jgi:hypothetical protein
LKEIFTSDTNFYVLKRFAEDFELIEIEKTGAKNIVLTDYGLRFRDDLYTQFISIIANLTNESQAIKELTTGQTKLLLEVLVNGNFTRLKVNIFHFMRFVQLTEGNWLPKQSSKLTKAECQYLNDIFNSSYRSRTLKDLLLQTCTFCEELGLINRLALADELYDKLLFTSLGSRVYNYFEQLLHVERERHQIPMQAV